LSGALSSAQIARYAARLQGQRLLPLLRGWQIRRAIRRLTLDGGPPALAALKESADKGLLREERYRKLLEVVLILDVDQPQAEDIRAWLRETPEEEAATSRQPRQPEPAGEITTNPASTLIGVDQEQAPAADGNALAREHGASEAGRPAADTSGESQDISAWEAHPADGPNTPAGTLQPDADHRQAESGEAAGPEQQSQPEDDIDVSEEADEDHEDVEDDDEHDEDDDEEKPNLLDSCSESDGHEADWDPLDEPDHPWISILDRYVHLDREERKSVIAQMAQSDLSIEEWIERLLHQQEEQFPTFEQLISEQPMDAMLTELWLPGDPIEDGDHPLQRLAGTARTPGAGAVTSQAIRQDCQAEDSSSELPDHAAQRELVQGLIQEEEEAAITTAAVAPAAEGQATRSTLERSAEPPSEAEQEIQVSASLLSQLLLEDWERASADPIIEDLVNCATELLNNDSTRQTGLYDTLLAGLLTFHLREKLANENDFAAHLAMNEEALEQDSDCIAKATLVSTEPFRRNKHQAIYRFDARQPFRHGGRQNRTEELVCQQSGGKLEISEVMATEGLIKLAVPSGEASALLPLSNLIHRPQDFSRLLRPYLAEQAPAWIADQAALPPAVHHLLSRLGSDRIRRLSQQVREHPEQTAQWISEALFDADGLSLILQGPPGTGKTTCAARVITTLVDAGCNIGVCANSHLAIDNLLFRTAELAGTTQQPINLAKFQGGLSKEEREAFGVAGIKVIDGNSFQPTHDVYGGTAFAFSHPRFDGLLDLLVIDEASQVSLANLLAMGRCARNLLLVGDQQQLPQPTMAEHPGESGLSCLGYATAGEPVIPEHKGVFLSRSWRLPPNLCGFISEQFYERRLEAESRNTANRILWTGQSSGLQFEAVSHRDNHVYSLEEVATVERLVSELLGRSYTRQSAEGPISGTLTWDDIAIVAPFNAQVNLLQRQLGREARVGTVDRFQGREAPVCIYSVTTSRTLSTRGLEFVLDANRVNVAISRAQCLAIVVASPLVADLLQTAETLQRELLLFQHLSSNTQTNPTQP
jgi:hypothetical protein